MLIIALILIHLIEVHCWDEKPQYHFFDIRFFFIWCFIAVIVNLVIYFTCCAKDDTRSIARKPYRSAASEFKK